MSRKPCAYFVRHGLTSPWAGTLGRSGHEAERVRACRRLEAERQLVLLVARPSREARTDGARRAPGAGRGRPSIEHLHLAVRRRAQRQLPRRRSAMRQRLARCDLARPERSSLEIACAGWAARRARRRRRSAAAARIGIRQLDLLVDLAQQLLDRALGLARTRPRRSGSGASTPRAVPQVERGPHLVAVQRARSRSRASMRDGEPDAEPRDRLRRRRPISSAERRTEGECTPMTRRPDARVAAVPLEQVGQRAQRVQRAVVPEPHQHARCCPSSVPTRTNGALIHSISAGNSGSEMSAVGRTDAAYAAGGSLVRTQAAAARGQRARSARAPGSRAARSACGPPRRCASPLPSSIHGPSGASGCRTGACAKACLIVPLRPPGQPVVAAERPRGSRCRAPRGRTRRSRSLALPGGFHDAVRPGLDLGRGSSRRDGNRLGCFVVPFDVDVL